LQGINKMRFLDETNLITRDDTFFGVCQGLGEDLGISGNWFRLALAIGTFFSPLGVIAAYAAGGVIVFTTRMLVPVPASAGQPALASAAPADAEPLPLAA
jgi:phage shock protein PspC (stress-responsive transcriptional regulator)